MQLVNLLSDLTRNIVVAIDGPAAAGKGTMAKRIARDFDLYYCQTSLFYRLLAKSVIDQCLSDVANIIECAKTIEYCESNSALYTADVTAMASSLGAIGSVRDILTIPQQQLLMKHKRILMEGRDIGTVIAPHADVKIFLTCDPEVRAERRLQEMLKNGVKVTIEEVLSGIIDRDKRDSLRAQAPLSVAHDAIVVDSTSMDANQVYDYLMKLDL